LRNLRYDGAVKYLSITALAAAAFIGCVRIAPTRQFGPLGKVSAIDVSIHKKDGFSDISKISDAKQIAAIVAFIDQRNGNWGTPWYGIPAPRVDAGFHDGDKVKGHFGVGRNFFECQRDGAFFSKDASAPEIEEFLKLIDVDDATFQEALP